MKIIAVLLVLIAAAFTSNAADTDFLYETYDTLPYRIYVPDNYDADKTYPLILYLHGAGERGDDNIIHTALLENLLAEGMLERYPAVWIAPQCPENEQWVNTDWGDGSYSVDDIPESDALKKVCEIVGRTADEYSIDRSRMYITGLSMGGYGTWDMIMRHPDMFAAAIPICGAADPSKAGLIKDMPIWTFHGDRDPVVPFSGTEEMAEAVRAAGSTGFRFTVYEGGGHDAWSRTYSNAEVFEWLFCQSDETNAVVSDKNLPEYRAESEVIEKKIQEIKEYLNENTDENSSVIYYVLLAGLIIPPAILLIRSLIKFVK